MATYTVQIPRGNEYFSKLVGQLQTLRARSQGTDREVQFDRDTGTWTITTEYDFDATVSSALSYLRERGAQVDES